MREALGAGEAVAHYARGRIESACHHSLLALILVNPRRSGRSQSFVLLALFVGALAISTSGVFVRLAQTGPTATAFWRGLFAIPALALWMVLERRNQPSQRSLTAWLPERGMIWAGVFFAGDLLLWHWSLILTPIAVATLEANLAPLFVTLILWLGWRERPTRSFVIATALALVGLVLMVSPKLGAGGGSLLGDLYGVGTAVFYAAYFVCVSRLRAHHGTGYVMFWSTLIFTVLLLPIALTQKFFPDNLEGWALLVGLALVVQVVGQSLLAYALAHLPASFGSLSQYLQPVAAAVYAWVLLGEQLLVVQIVGALVVLSAIAIARRFQVALPAASAT